MEAWRNLLHDWYVQLSPRARWTYGLVGVGLVVLLLLIFGQSGASNSYVPIGVPGPMGYGGYAQPTGGSPADRWLNGTEFQGRMSSGTFDPSGQGNHVIGVDGQVLNLR
jgi:hypothetical protein